MSKNFEWVKNEKGDWSSLRITNLNSLDLSESLKVQEMFTAAEHQRSQIRLNKLLVVLNIFVVLGGLYTIMKPLIPNNYLDIFHSSFFLFFIIMIATFLRVASEDITAFFKERKEVIKKVFKRIVKP